LIHQTHQQFFILPLYKIATSLRSPDDKWAAFVKDHNLYMQPLPDGEEIQLTSDGEPRYDYADRTEGNTSFITNKVLEKNYHGWQPGLPIPKNWSYTDWMRGRSKIFIYFSRHRPMGAHALFSTPTNTLCPAMKICPCSN